MSKLFTVLTAVLISLGGAAAGYFYFTGTSLHQASAPNGVSEESSCPLCEQARKKSCCDGESLAKKLAMSKQPTFSCCSDEEVAKPSDVALSGIVGNAAIASK